MGISRPHLTDYLSLVIMNKADIYILNNPMQMKDSSDVLQEFKDSLSWDRNEIVLDIGCGPGNVTENVLKPVLPEDAKIVGCDVSEIMVSYANAKYGCKSVCFKQMDIESYNIWDCWDKQWFNKIFSFYCLHWIQDQRTAAENMFDLLKPGGAILVAFLAENPIFSLYEELSLIPKWKPFMTNVAKFVSPYHKSEDPGREYTKILENAKFENINSISKDVVFKFSSMKILLKAIEAVNPFLENIPVNMREAYMFDMENIILRQKLTDADSNGGQIIRYKLVVANASKPL